MLIHGGSTWTKKNFPQDGIAVWRCTRRSSAKCPSILWTKNNHGKWETAKITDHSHDPNPNAVIKCRADGAVRAAVVGGVSSDTVQNVIAQTVGNTPVTDHVVLSESRLRRTVCSAKKQVRKANNEGEGVCTSLEALVLPPRMLEDRGESILFGDTGSHQNRMLTLGLPRHLCHTTCNCWNRLPAYWEMARLKRHQTCGNNNTLCTPMFRGSAFPCSTSWSLERPKCSTRSCCASPQSWVPVSPRNLGCSTFRPA